MARAERLRPQDQRGQDEEGALRVVKRRVADAVLRQLVADGRTSKWAREGQVGTSLSSAWSAQPRELTLRIGHNPDPQPSLRPFPRPCALDRGVPISAPQRTATPPAGGKCPLQAVAVEPDVPGRAPVQKHRQNLRWVAGGTNDAADHTSAHAGARTRCSPASRSVPSGLSGLPARPPLPLCLDRHCGLSGRRDPP